MTPWIKRLVIANALVFLLTYNAPALGYLLAFSRQSALAAPWTIITYMFVHANFGHIFWNMIGLMFLGPRVETRLGGPRFLGLYFVGGVAGGLASIALSPVGIVGASAAVYAVILGYAMFWPWDRLLLFFVVPVPAMIAVMIFAVVSLFGGFGYIEPGVAHWGHLGGFVGGYVYLTILRHQTGSQRFRAKATPTAPRPKSPDVIDRWRRIDPSTLHPVNRDELTRILAKLDGEGATALTDDERVFLERFSS